MVQSNASDAADEQISRSKRLLTYAHNTVKYIAVAVSFSLCVWQATVCVNRYLDEPTSFRIAQEPFKSFAFPPIAICPASTDYPFNLRWRFQQKCELDETCKTLNQNERMDYPFVKLDTSFPDLWNNRSGDPTIEWVAKCKYAINQTLCRERRWMHIYEVHMAAGRCKIIYPNIGWDFFGKYLSLRIRLIDNTDFVPTEPDIGRYMIDFVPTTPLLFAPRMFAEDGATNEIEFTFVQYDFLNTSRRPCQTIYKFDRCRRDCVVSQFIDQKPDCKWPPFEKADVPYCNTMSEVEEAGKLIFELTHQDYEYCDCKTPCSIFDYEMTHFTTKNLPINTTEMKIFMPDSRKLVWTQFHVFPFSALVAELGGSIGLFHGVSVLSILTDLESLWFRVLKARKKDSKNQIIGNANV